MQSAGYSATTTDALILHQANKFIIESIAQKAGFTKLQAPSGAVEKYGNQSSASIPCALIDSLTDQMKNAAGELQFEVAAKLRDEIRILKKELRMMEEAGV